MTDLSKLPVSEDVARLSDGLLVSIADGGKMLIFDPKVGVWADKSPRPFVMGEVMDSKPLTASEIADFVSKGILSQ